MWTRWNNCHLPCRDPRWLSDLPRSGKVLAKPHPCNQGRHKWYGPIVDNHQGVGMLIHTSLWHLTGQQATPQETGTRVVIVKVGKHTIQGVYSPYIGKGKTKELKAFLGVVVESHKQAQGVADEGITWTMRDFNMQGIDPGHQSTPREGSQRKRLAQGCCRCSKSST